MSVTDPVDSADVEPRDAAIAAARAADAKSGTDTIVFDVGDVFQVTGWFVVTSGANTPQIKAIVDHVIERLSEDHGLRPLRTEGVDARRWVLLDYGDFVVHVFHAEEREYYAIERLWSDAERVDWSDGA